MLETGLHVHDDHIVLAEDQARENGLEHHMLGTHAAAAAGVHGAHDQELDAVTILAQLIRQIGDLGI